MLYICTNKQKDMPYKNEEKRKAYDIAYGKANREKKTFQRRLLRESKKDGLYTVYYLPKENYIGMTSSLTARLQNHSNDFNRHIEDVEIFGKYETKREALDIETELHLMGYKGANANYIRGQQLNK